MLHRGRQWQTIFKISMALKTLRGAAITLPLSATTVSPKELRTTDRSSPV